VAEGNDGLHFLQQGRAAGAAFKVLTHPFGVIGREVSFHIIAQPKLNF
jgi:hypothetical protein